MNQIMPERKGSDRSFQKVGPYLPTLDQLQGKPRSPPLFSTTPTGSTNPNTPSNPMMMGMNNMTGMPLMSPQLMHTSSLPQMNNGINVIPNTYNAQPYFTENTSSPPGTNHTATTSGNLMRKENPKLIRPAPYLDMSELREFKGIYLLVPIIYIIRKSCKNCEERA